MSELAPLTTLRLGGPARRLVEARTQDEAIEAVRAADESGEPLLVLAGGSNVVIADGGFPGTVVRLLTSGIARSGTVLEAQAGEPWDPLVARCVRDALAGVECLAGIPGSVGATPIQNVGAYGQDVSQTITRVRAYDRSEGVVQELANEACEFTYRSSAFKRDPGRWLVLAVTFALDEGPLSKPIAYPELARALGVSVGDAAPLAEVREAVLALRRGKGMVIDRSDPDSVSAGSFFTNPILTTAEFESLRARAAPYGEPPGFPEPDGRVKTSAAWLVERAGFPRGYGMPGPAAISTKHSLALTNRGGATTAELLALAREVAGGVERAFGVRLVPEPVLVGEEWAER